MSFRVLVDRCFQNVQYFGVVASLRYIWFFFSILQTTRWRVLICSFISFSWDYLLIFTRRDIDSYMHMCVVEIFCNAVSDTNVMSTISSVFSFALFTLYDMHRIHCSLSCFHFFLSQFEFTCTYAVLQKHSVQESRMKINVPVCNTRMHLVRWHYFISAVRSCSSKNRCQMIKLTVSNGRVDAEYSVLQWYEIQKETNSVKLPALIYWYSY